MEIIINSKKYGKYTLLYDEEDYEIIKDHKWRIKNVGKCFYAVTDIKYINKKITIRMHRLIMGFPEGMHIDHINHNGLDNRKCNLRECTGSQNNANQRNQIGKSSKYKGVCFNKNRNKFVAAIKKDKKQKYLGIYISEIDAAKSYNKAAIEYFGEFANLNVIDEVTV